MILALKTVTYAIPDPETHLSFVSYTFWRFYLIWPMGALLFLEASLSMCKAEFQRIARRDKKVFLSIQCKEIEENNRMKRLEISSTKLEIPREHSCKDGLNKG